MKSMYLTFLGLMSCAGTLLAQQDAHKFADFAKYASSNQEMRKQEVDVVFLGNSITEGWVTIHPSFFEQNGYVGRGISGQTSYQFLLRFREDVIRLSPKVVVINAGTNDIAENTGKYVEEYTFGNIVSMVELAQAHHIKVILTSVLPAAEFRWNASIKDASEKIESLNHRISSYAKEKGIPYVDYYQQMVKGENRALNPNYTNDGVHPTLEGYLVMEKLIHKAVEEVLGTTGK